MDQVDCIKLSHKEENEETTERKHELKWKKDEEQKKENFYSIFFPS
jgi:hypothetical protein